MTDPAIIVARRVVDLARARLTVSKFADGGVLLTVDGGGVVVDVHATANDLDRICCAVDDVSVGAARWPHVADSDCDVNDDTGSCRECGTHHGDACANCGGRGFHVETCEVGR